MLLLLISIISLIFLYNLSYQVSLFLIKHRYFSKDVVQRSSQGRAVLVIIGILSLNNYSFSLCSHFKSLHYVFEIANLIGCTWSLKFALYFIFWLLMIPERTPVHASVTINLLCPTRKAKILLASAQNYITSVLQLHRRLAPWTILELQILGI
jgi:hypothetical protein